MPSTDRNCHYRLIPQRGDSVRSLLNYTAEDAMNCGSAIARLIVKPHQQRLNAGGPSVLIAYGAANALTLERAAALGVFLNFPIRK